MRKSIILCSVLLISGSVFSQALDLGIQLENAKKRNALQYRLRSTLNKPTYSTAKEAGKQEYKTPVIKIPLEGQYVGNNKAGADIYAMQPYNMPCLSPDSTFASKMPVALKSSTITILKKPTYDGKYNVNSVSPPQINDKK
jgi:hypothetical protein